ncbi:maleylacetoacetate isomerase [Sphingobium yanoikuyae]|uniref:maleylacetoacetate isomerase n=1 Tax=Sphingobium yanoikuyae TaxID=13690 RepID=UPI000A59363B|nr:maleylacetoacetate isomerase [Sphingobium yanoikuyae]
MTLLLHDYWRSTASYRVRIALNLKGLSYRQETHDLRRGEQASPDYAAINPQKLVPTLMVEGATLAQSPAILEWLEEGWPDPPLLPQGLNERAIVRAMTAIVVSDIHPINNLRVLNRLRGELRASEDQVSAWIAHWIGEGFTALERLVDEHGATFAFGDQPTFADCALVPQLYSAERFRVDLTPYPRLAAVGAAARGLAAFDRAHPSRQADADAPPA